MDILRGQFVTGRSSLSTETGLTEQEIRTALTKLKSTGEITIKSTSKFSVLTVCNYEKYQACDDNDQPAIQPALQPQQQPAINQQSTTNKNEKNVRSKEEKIIGEKSTARRNGFDFSFSKVEHIKGLQDFIDLRKTKKNVGALTQRSLELNYNGFLKAAEHFNASFDDVVDFTVMKGWASPNIEYMKNSGFNTELPKQPTGTIRCHLCDCEINPVCRARTDEKRKACTDFREKAA